jgi:AraC-like DNA-binding protein
MKHPFDFGIRNEHHLSTTFHSHSEYEIFYFHRGYCTYLIGDQIHILQPGDLIVMHGMTLHCPKIVKGKEYVRSVIHFEPSYFRSLLEQIQTPFALHPFEALRNHRISLDETQQAEMEALLSRLQASKQSTGPLSETRGKVIFLDLLLFVYECFQQPLKYKQDLPSHREERVQEIVHLIEQQYMNDLHLSDLEEQMHMSRFYMAKLFKEVTGVTIFEYLYQRRINQAKVLFLTEAGKSVTDICFEVGFKHPAHFSRTFKTKVGMTPEHYRRQVKLESAPPV